jgi:hypothetical protein
MNLFNPSHCADPTAKVALEDISKEKKKIEQARRAKDTIGCALRMFSLAGYEVISELIIRSRATGAIYRAKSNKGENPKK